MSEPTISPKEVGFFVFDIESVAHGQLVADVRFPGQSLAPDDAIARYRQELLEKYGTDFVPYTYQIPVAAVIAKVRHDFSLADIVCLDEPEFRPHIITDHFWRGWEGYGRPTFVSFNGRSFDMPLMELAAFRYGISATTWFNDQVRSFEQPRYRYNSAAHIDLQDVLVNFGAARFSGGLDLAATILGKPGKMTVRGDMVQDMYQQGELEKINDYCRCDVLDTYFVFLRTRVVMGKMTLDREQEIVCQTKEWLVERADDSPAYAAYLDHWSEWPNPWREANDETASAEPTPAAGDTASASSSSTDANESVTSDAAAMPSDGDASSAQPTEPATDATAN